MCLLGLFLFVWHGPLPFEGLVRALAKIDYWQEGWPLASNPGTLRKYYALSLATAFFLTGLVALLVIAWRRLNETAQGIAWRVVSTLACSCAMLIYMTKMQFEGPWLPIVAIMEHPAGLPVFGHRLLFVWVAKLFSIAGLSHLRSYYASQIVATLLALYAIGRWSAAHAGEAFSLCGQMLAVVLVSTCFAYYNFYDIAIVFFFTCGLLALYRRAYKWFVLLVAVGTLNHESILLLIPVAAFLMYDSEPRRKWAFVVAASLVAHFLVRGVMQAAIPFDRQVDWRIWSNMVKPWLNTHEMVYTPLALAGWYALALMSLRYCDARLRRLTLLFPLLFGVTFLVGQMQEPRQFSALIPVLVAVFVTATKRKLELASAR